MTLKRLELLQWYALFGGALAWASQHVAGYFVSTAACGSVGWHTETPQIALAVAAALAILAAEGAAIVVFRETSGLPTEAPPPYGRLRFFAQAAMLGNVLFLVITLLNGFGTVYHLPCAQS
ncbi:MAG TPA: hypothetical protein VHV52_12405 [Gaiellaceae bacterium]|jgi:hypothetical protein|nr:hypothetical protein [Gaiellaceae bacterium]